ncbi:hypothetical protein [Micromonospora sp. NPDC005113]
MSLLDLGLDSSFDAAMTFVQSTLQNINAGCDEPIVDIDFVRSRDPDTVLSAFTASCEVLHVMAHGDHSVTPTFSSTDGKVEISLEQLGEAAANAAKASRRAPSSPMAARPAPACGRRQCGTVCREK